MNRLKNIPTTQLEPCSGYIVETVQTKKEKVFKEFKTCKLSSKQRLIESLNHRTPDRVCVDFGGGGQTGMGVCAVDRLRKAVLKDESYRVKVIEPYQMLGEIDERLRDKLQIDVVGILPSKTMFGFENKGWKPFNMFDGTAVLVPEDFNVKEDNNGGLLIYPQGDTSVKPSGKMPKEGYFFDSIIRQQPFDEKSLFPKDNIESDFGFLKKNEIKYFVDQTEKAAKNDSGIMLTMPGTSFGDIACVPAPWAKDPKGIREIEEWYISPLLRPDFVIKVFEMQCEIALENLNNVINAVEPKNIQVISISATDFGTQRGLFVSPDIYRKFYKPFQKRVNELIHKRTNWKIFMHSCGAIFELMPDFIEAGFDIINPVQCSADGMEPKKLKKQFGKDIIFWGGGVDTQKTLPFGTPEQVYEQVRERIDIFNEDGGFVFSSIHNIQSNTPLDNILAMFKAIEDSYK